MSLLSTFFSCSPVPECFSPGTFDLVGHSRQLSGLLLALSTLVQQEALCQDFLRRRPAIVREYGEQRLLLTGLSFFICLALAGAVMVLATRGKQQWCGAQAEQREQQ